MNTLEITSSWSSSSPCEPELFFHSGGWSGLLFYKVPPQVAQRPRNHAAVLHQQYRAWGHGGPASLGTPDGRLALPMLCPAMCLQPRRGSGCRENMPEQHTLPQQGEAWKAALRSDTHNTAGSLVFFCELKKNTRKQLTFFNVNVSCLLPTVVSDTLNVPFFASSFNRSSRVLLQEI